MERGREFSASPEVVNIASFRQSHGLSRMLLTNHLDMDVPLSEEPDTDIPTDVKAILEKGSLQDRKRYWVNKGKYGQQMITWLRGDKTNKIQGIAEWGSTQKDSDTVAFLRNLGYTERDATSLASRRTEIREIAEKINKDLPEDSQLNVETMPASEVNALYFYESYLHPQEYANDPVGTSKFLGNVVDSVLGMVDVSKDESEQVDDAVKILQKIAPLLSVTGEEAQHAYAAAIMAKIHAQKELDKVKASTVDQNTLGAHEQRVVRFMQYSTNSSIDDDTMPEGKFGVIEPLESAKQYSLEGIMGMVKDPPAKKGDNRVWWINGRMQSQDEILAGLSKDYDGLKGLERPENFFLSHPNQELADAGYFWPNFPPINDINPHDDPNSRFGRLEALTNRDSGLLALAGVSRETPQQEAELYKVLGSAIFQIHKNNPELLRTFLKNQTQVSLNMFMQNELNQTGSFVESVFAQYGVKVPTRESSEQERDSFEQLFQQLQTNSGFIKDIRQASLQQEAYLRKSLQEADSKLLMLSIDLADPAKRTVDLDATVQGWRARIDSGELQKALDNGQLTLEYIRNVEFLAHSVNVAEIMKWLQKHPQTETATDSPHPESPHDEDLHSELVTQDAILVTDLMGKVKAEVDRTTNPYFVERVKAPSEVVEEVEREIGFDKLEKTEPIYIAYDPTVPAPSRVHINPAIFPADEDLHERDNRYKEAKGLSLTSGNAENYLLALAASSAENPQKQAQLFEGLARVIVEAHLKDEGLFKRFLEMQQQPRNEANLAILITDEQSVAGPKFEQERDKLLREEFGDAIPPIGSEKWVSFVVPLQKAFFQDIEGKPDRMLSFTTKEGEPFAVFRNVLDIDRTHAAWKPRFQELRDALTKDPVALTSDQLMQLEFLAHSIDTIKVIEWMRGEPVVRTRRTFPETPDVMGENMSVAPPAPHEGTEGLTPPLPDIKHAALEEFSKRDREGVKEGAGSAAISYEERRFYYLRSFLLDWNNEQRVGALEDALGIISLNNVSLFLNDKGRIGNPDNMLEFDSVFQGNLSMYGFGKGQHAMRNVFGELSIDQSEALHKLLQEYANNQMNAEFPLAMRLLGLHVSTEDWKKESEKSTSKLSPNLQEKLLSLELQVGDVSKKFSSDEKKFLMEVLSNMPTRADQLMTILYYYTLWHERQRGSKKPGKKHLISDLRRTANKTKERLGGKDELEYFVSSQNS